MKSLLVSYFQDYQRKSIRCDAIFLKNEYSLNTLGNVVIWNSITNNYFVGYCFKSDDVSYSVVFLDLEVVIVDIKKGLPLSNL